VSGNLTNDFVNESCPQFTEPFMVSNAERHQVFAGDKNALSRDDGGASVHFSLNRCHDFERVNAASEGFGEGPTDGPLERALKVIEETHALSPIDGLTPMVLGSVEEKLVDGALAGGLCAVLISPLLHAMCATTARVAELADALASGASARKGVGVQVPPRARVFPIGG